MFYMCWKSHSLLAQSICKVLFYNIFCWSAVQHDSFIFPNSSPLACYCLPKAGIYQSEYPRGIPTRAIFLT
jgi:hypothetical protein